MKAKFYNPDKEEDDFQIRIDRNGQWFHQGSPIPREKLIKLFATVLHHDKDNNEYWLITPHEQGRIEVEDTPFIINDFEFDNGILTLQSNLEHSVAPDKTTQLFLKNDIPYATVGNQIPARINRSVREKLIHIALDQDHNKNYNGDTPLILKANNHDHIIARP